MKVIHILHELKYSGAEIMYVDAAPVFQELGCKLCVIATAHKLGEYAPSFEKAGYKVYHKPIPPKTKIIRRINYYILFIRFLKKEKIDVVHNHSSATFWAMALCAKLAGIRSAHTFHNVFPTNWYSKFYHIVLRKSTKYFFKCRFQSISDSVFSNEEIRFKNKTTKVYNWYGSNRFYPATDDEKMRIRQELNITSNTPVLISIGGCSHIKQHAEILKALPLIIKKYPECIYLHLGTGDIEAQEHALAKSLNLENHVRFFGNQQNVRKYLIASDIYLMTSKFEGISLTTIEAMACMVPTILYDVPGLHDFNSEGENSILIPEDFHTLAEQVIFLLQNRDFGMQLAKRAKEFVDGKFSMNENAKKIYSLYN